MEIGVRELKNSLSIVLQRASEGEKITITHHGRPICTLSAFQESAFKEPAFLKLAAAQGWLTPASAIARRVAVPIKPKRAGKSTTELLQESRTERF